MLSYFLMKYIFLIIAAIQMKAHGLLYKICLQHVDIVVRYILESNFFIIELKISSKRPDKIFWKFSTVYELEKYVFLLSDALFFWYMLKERTGKFSDWFALYAPFYFKLHLSLTGSQFLEFQENYFDPIVTKVTSNWNYS
jgi:hypothetical protein